MSGTSTPSTDMECTTSPNTSIRSDSGPPDPLGNEITQVAEVSPGQECLESEINERIVLINKNIVESGPTILENLMERNTEQEEWFQLLGAAPKAITSIGLCLIASRSGGNFCRDIIQTSKPLPPDLLTNITNCYDLGLEAFNEAEDGMSWMAKKIKRITDRYGCMDDIHYIVQEACNFAGDSAKLKEALSDLRNGLVDLKTPSEYCMERSGTILEKFQKWMSHAKDINSAFTEVCENEKRRVNNSGWGNSGWGVGLRRFFTKPPKSKPKNTTQDIEELREYFSTIATKQDILEVLQFCLNNLIDIKENLEHLHRFFRKLNNDIDDIFNFQIPRLESLVKQSGENKMRMYTVKKLHKQTLSIHIDWLLVGAKSTVYSKSSTLHIMPGIKLISKLSKSADTEVKDQLMDILKYSETTRDKIAEFTKGSTSIKPIKLIVGTPNKHG